MNEHLASWEKIRERQVNCLICYTCPECISLQAGNSRFQNMGGYSRTQRIRNGLTPNRFALLLNVMHTAFGSHL